MVSVKLLPLSLSTAALPALSHACLLYTSPDEERERCEIYVNLPQETLKFYDKLWTQLGV